MQAKLIVLTYLSCVSVAFSLNISPFINKSRPPCVQIDNKSVFNDKELQSYLANVKVTTPEAGCPPARFLEPIRRRTDIGLLLKELGLKGVGVEVGVQRGVFTEHVLDFWGQAHTYVQVDLWEHQENYKDNANVNDAQHANFQTESCSRGQKSASRNQTKTLLQCKNYSTSCVNFFPDNSLDFVYIDARHDRLGVLEDLKAYWPKVRMGGVMAGHDYTVQDEPGDISDPARTHQNWTTNYNGTVDESKRVVKGAVDDFF